MAERLLVTSASMTSLFDTLERRGFVERRAHPTDRRKVLVHLTDAGARVVDLMLPVVHGAATEVFGALPVGGREQLIESLSTVRARLAEVAAEPPPAPKARRRQRRP